MRRAWALPFAPVVVLGGAAFFAYRHPLHAETTKLKETEPLRLRTATHVVPPDVKTITPHDFRQGPSEWFAPLPGGRIAHLTLDRELHDFAVRLLAHHHLPEASIVMLDADTGEVLAYASHAEHGAVRDFATVAKAPAASVFKVVTGAALVENAGVTPDQKECYSGGGSEHINQSDLTPNPARDKWCVTVAGAMGRSLNTVFARLAQQKLQPKTLDATAHAFGFGTALPFDLDVQPSEVHIPEDSLGFARTAAGFWNTTLSPLHAAVIAGALAHKGELVRPRIVRSVEEAGHDVYEADGPTTFGRVAKEETVNAVATMMDKTVAEGTSYRAFHDNKGQAFLPGVRVSGKTGTLTDAAAQRYYTWFVGFAHKNAAPPAGPPAPPGRRIAIAVLAVNHATWHVKANTLAREMLRATFAREHVPNVTFPALTPQAEPARRVAAAN